MRRRLTIEGLVQGVGFRPFVFVLAKRYTVCGWVRNTGRGVEIEIEGPTAQLEGFVQALTTELPPLAHISRLRQEEVPEEGGEGFVIRTSDAAVSRRAQITPDAHVCDDCLKELFDPADRRYRYPFINCTNCGPRFTIVQDIPYDRAKTTMAVFPMCPRCQREYDDPTHRRFHAQPNACPDCGPQLSLLDSGGTPLVSDDPIRSVQKLLRQGRIVAIKGLGGYHLAVDPRNDAAVAELRRRKVRDEKPFALMARDLAATRRLAEVSAAEAALLTQVARPIVLLRQRSDVGISPLVAPHNRYWGIMLPGTPLHHLLMEAFDALIMTSGNLSDEPIAFGDSDARARLGGIADAFLTHNRAIETRTDDSIVRLMAGRPVPLRRSRGYVPRAVYLPLELPPVLALGAELKNTICLTQDDRAFLSQHIGDLKNDEVVGAFVASIAHLQRLLEVQPRIWAHDRHPDYASTRHALAAPAEITRVAVQHHHAHLASCLMDNGVTEPAIGLIFDGIGYGDDGHIWGGEFLVGDLGACQRRGHFLYVPMPGGDAATREPYRMALSYLDHAYGEEKLPPLPGLETIPAADRQLLQQMIRRRINAPLTSSCGRLFDAVAALAGIRQRVSYEGQAALELEQAIVGDTGLPPYPHRLVHSDGLWLYDHGPTLRAVAEDVAAGAEAGHVSRRFHLALAEMMTEVAERLRQETGLAQVALSGGVFQNRSLTEAAVVRLEDAGFRVLLHREVPPNDGGLALGQAAIAGWQLRG